MQQRYLVRAHETVTVAGKQAQRPGPEATGGDEPSGAAWPCPIDLLEETDGAAARGR